MSRNILHKSSIFVFVNNINLLIGKYGGPLAFSRKIEAGYQAVFYWSKGQNLPDGRTLLKIHEKCGVSIDWLLTGKDSAGAKCPHCGDWPDDIRDLCATVKKILESDDEVVRNALQFNIAAFRQSIEKNKKLQMRPNKTKSRRKPRDKPLGGPAGTDPAAKSAVG